MNCEVCEDDYGKDWQDKLHSISLGLDLSPNESVNFRFCCDTCSLQLMVSFYRTQYEKTRGREEALKSELNLFKSVLLRPETMSAIADDPMSDQPSAATIRRRLNGIENFTIDQIQFWLETYELYARGIAELLSKKATKEEIKQALANKTRAVIQGQKNREKEEKAIERKPMVKLSAEDKALRSMMKTLGISEEAARGMLSSLPKGN